MSNDSAQESEASPSQPKILQNSETGALGQESVSASLQQDVTMDHNESSNQALGSGAEPANNIEEQRKCWICLQDESDDTPLTSRWRSPCSCHLQAHESCLLDWVAEIERGGIGSGGKSKVECPQCRTQIRVIRPRSLFLEVLKKVQWIKGITIIPVTIIGLASGLVICCYVHGLGSIYLVFGAEDARRIIQYNPEAWACGLLNAANIALPFVPMGLLLSRTSYYPMALPFLPLPLLFLGKPTADISDWWPPSAALTFLTLPYIGTAYDLAYKYFFANKEKAWLKELRPRGTDDGNVTQPDDQAAPDRGGAGLGIELGIEVEIEEEAEVVEDQAAPEGQPDQPQGQHERGDEAQAPAPAPAQDQVPLADQLAPPVQQNDNQNGNGVANALPILINVVLEKAIGTLLFPGIAAGMGCMLKWTLPSAWTKPVEVYPPSMIQHLIGLSTGSHRGFLQSRFGRSVAGGLLFIFLKDSIGLYTKYRMATVQRQRSIADYKGKRAGSETGTKA